MAVYLIQNYNGWYLTKLINLVDYNNNNVIMELMINKDQRMGCGYLQSDIIVLNIQ